MTCPASLDVQPESWLVHSLANQHLPPPTYPFPSLPLPPPAGKREDAAHRTQQNTASRPERERWTGAAGRPSPPAHVGPPPVPILQSHSPHQLHMSRPTSHTLSLSLTHTHSYQPLLRFTSAHTSQHSAFTRGRRKGPSAEERKTVLHILDPSSVTQWKEASGGSGWIVEQFGLRSRAGPTCSPQLRLRWRAVPHAASGRLRMRLRAVPHAAPAVRGAQPEGEESRSGPSRRRRAAAPHRAAHTTLAAPPCSATHHHVSHTPVLE